MALINIGSAKGSEIGNPTEGDFYLFLNSEQGNALVRRNYLGEDNIYAPSANNIVFVDSLDKLPTPVNGVINLIDGFNYEFVDFVDLNGNRIFCDGVVSISGISPETCGVFSLGLDATEPLITSNNTISLSNIDLEHDTILDLDALGNGGVIDWYGVNFSNAISKVGTIKDYNNVIMNTIGFLNSGGLSFDGTTGTISFVDTIFQNANGLTSVIVRDSCTITRRFRITNSSFISLSGETALNVSTSASIPNDSYILKGVNFAGGGDYIVGVQNDDNKARFKECKGIDNSFTIGQYYFQDNTLPTVITTRDEFFEIVGTIQEGNFLQRFDLDVVNSRITYTGSLMGLFKISASISLTSATNKEIKTALFKNNEILNVSVGTSTTRSNGRAENISCQDIVELQENDFLDLRILNFTDTNNITVESINVIIEKLG